MQTVLGRHFSEELFGIQLLEQYLSLHLQKLLVYVNRCIARAHWSYVWGVKGRWDERKKLEAGIEVNKEVLNEEGRGHYHDEIVREVEKLCGYLPEGTKKLYVPHENFNRDIGATKGKNFNVDGTPFEGNDDDWQAYLHEVMPREQDEIDLKELFNQEWIANKPMSTRQIDSGIGASA